MKLLRPLIRETGPKAESRYTLEDYANWVAQSYGWGTFGFSGHQYPLGLTLTDPKASTQPIGENFEGHANQGFRASGVVWSLELIRIQVFSQVRFAFRSFNRNRLFRSEALAPLELASGASNIGLLARMILDADLAGNFYGVLAAGRIVRLRPDWVDTVFTEEVTEAGPIGQTLVGYLYWPDGERGGGAKPTSLRPGEVVHFAPYPDPLAHWRGMSWLTPVVREIMGDIAYTRHKMSFVDNAATPNLAVSLKETVTPEDFIEFVETMDQAHKGPTKAGKTLYLGGGADVTVVGADMHQLDFKVVQGAGETRLAAAAGVGAVVAQFSEGMQGSSLNAGNYGAARRRFADVTMRHLWQEAAAALSSVIEVPRVAELWYDQSLVSFLQEDAKDAAEIVQVNATTIAGLVNAGFTAESAMAAVMAGDMSLLDHTDLVSVQLQPPGSTAPNSNGNQSVPVGS